MTIRPDNFVLINGYPHLFSLPEKKRPKKTQHPPCIPETLHRLPLERAVAKMVMQFYQDRKKAGHHEVDIGHHVSQTTWEELCLQIFDNIPTLHVAQFKTELTDQLYRSECQMRPWWDLSKPDKNKMLAPHQHGLDELIERLELKYGQKTQTQKTRSADETTRRLTDLLNELEQVYGPQIRQLYGRLDLNTMCPETREACNELQTLLERGLYVTA